MPAYKNQQPCQTWKTTLLCSLYCLGMFVTLLIYGLWQEKIMSRPYHTGTDMSEYLSAFSGMALPTINPKAWPSVDDYFQNSLLLVLISRSFGLVFALGMMMASGETCSWQASFWEYLLISVSTVAASTCQFEALKYVSFTLQILGKSFKTLLLMCWGFTVLSKNYRKLDWTLGFFFCGGVIAYTIEGQIYPDHNDGNACWGIFLLMCFVVLDGIASSYQERFFMVSDKSKYNQMMYINALSALLASVLLFILGEWDQTINFCTRHPLVLMDASIMSTSAVLAQWFVYAQVHGFGTLAFMATINLRQIISVVASIAAYHHRVTALQTAALSVCCGALLGQVLSGLCPAPAWERTPLLGKAKLADDSSEEAVLVPKVMGQPCVPCLGRDRSSQV